MQKIKYITNKELLAEIKLCKATYCSFVAPEYASYDAIVSGLEMITEQLLEETVAQKAVRMSSKLVIIDPTSIDRASIVFRVMTDDHLPIVEDKNKRRKLDSGETVKTNFNPFRHYILKDGKIIEVGRSHWSGTFEDGGYSVTHGRMSNRLASMFMLLVEQYSRRGNWRGYCGPISDQALSQRGWLNGDEITTNDRILSFNYETASLVWSDVDEVFIDHFEGDMFRLTGLGIDATVTPGHRFLTTNGLKPVEYLAANDKLILMGQAVADTRSDFQYSDAFVELIGWFVTEGNLYKSTEQRNYTRMSIFQNEGTKADQIRSCLEKLIPKWGETRRKARDANNKNVQIVFTLPKQLCLQIAEVITHGSEKVLSYDFINALSLNQRQLLIETMIAGDGVIDSRGRMTYAQKSKTHVDAFMLLATLNGYKPNCRYVTGMSYGKEVSYYLVNLAKTTHNHTRMVKSIDFHGGKNHLPGDILDHSNSPTEAYNGRVWCPRTQYGSFVVRSNGKVYLSGNSYNDEMRSHALTQLAQVGLQFDESRSDNPFSFFTQVIKNCLAGDTMILTREFGSVPIADVSEQDVTLLDGNGDWVKCHIYDYGIQETVNMNFFGGFEKVSVRSTMQHGWIQKDSKEVIETRHFVERNGYATRDVVLDDLRPAKIIKDEAAYRRGVVHGAIYGDGSYNSKRSYKIRLCSEKICLAPWFSDYPVVYYSSCDGEPVYFVNHEGCDLKAFPAKPGESLDYLLGFLRGWFATDGCASNEKPRICHGKLTEPTSQATLCCDEAEYDWLKKWGPLVGWQVRDFTTLAEKTNYGMRKKISLNVHMKKDSMDVEDFLRPKHRERWMTVTQKPKGWRVYPGARQDFTDRRMERVYCPEVTTTHSFALSNYNHTLNCFRRILNLEHRAQSIRDDLLTMSGAMPSYTRQVTNSIDQREEAPVEQKTPGKRGRKPKSDTE